MVAVIAGLILKANLPPLDRAAFARAENKIVKGMTKADIRTLLGPPDKEVKIEFRVDAATTEWLYGTAPGDDFPTLGAVNFDSDGKVPKVGSTSLGMKKATTWNTDRRPRICRPKI